MEADAIAVCVAYAVIWGSYVVAVIVDDRDRSDWYASRPPAPPPERQEEGG